VTNGCDTSSVEVRQKCLIYLNYFWLWLGSCRATSALSKASRDVHLGVAGESLMRGAVNNSLPGIEAECGGAMICARRHVAPVVAS
jgi:hypothetical protein